MERLNSSYIEIDLSSLYYNFWQIKKYVGEKTKILMIVKSNAYGHGILPSSFLNFKTGIDMLGVANIEEAINLCKRKVKLPILILSYILPEEIPLVIKYNLRQTVGDWEMVKKLSELAQKRKKKVKIHIKIDTGMGCIGIPYKEAVEFVRKVKVLKGIEIEGIFSHFAQAEKKNKFFSLKQIQRFKKIIQELENMQIKISLRHMANSAGILNLQESHFNMIRPGLILYGLLPSNEVSYKINLKPVLSLKTKIIYLKEVEKGQSISYDRTYITTKRTKIGIIPLGYADGYRRDLSNKGEVLVCGRRVPVIGRIRMDQTILNVTNIPEIKIGDEVVVIGQQGKEKITVEEIAKKTNTIPYEIICGLSSRIRRINKEVDFKKK